MFKPVKANLSQSDAPEGSVKMPPVSPTAFAALGTDVTPLEGGSFVTLPPALSRCRLFTGIAASP
jgi:hypothetical protein